MSYLVLARKYRPQVFSEVVGQDHVTKTLSNAFTQDRVHHAFLFCGPRGCGKTTTARILAKALNCEAGPTPTPCGTCQACVSVSNGSAVDYFEMDGASNRGIDAIRDLTEAVRYQPAILRKKVYVIDEVHMLTTEAFNALLKTLEEPPPHVTFVMATTEPHKVPNTILSRCQRFDFKLVPHARLAQHLHEIFDKEKVAIDAGGANLIVRESGGSVRDALSLSDQIISYVGIDGISEAKVAEVLGVADRSLTRSLVEALAAQDAAGALTAVDMAVARGVDEVQIARALVRYLRDLAVTQVAPNNAELVDAVDEERATLVEQAKSLEPSRVRQMFDRLLRTCDALGETEQPRLVLDLGLIDVAATQAVVPVDDIVARLGAMEKRLRSGGGASSGGGGAQASSIPKNAKGGSKSTQEASGSPAASAKSASANPVMSSAAKRNAAPNSESAAAPASQSSKQNDAALSANDSGPSAAPKELAPAAESAPSTDALRGWEEVMKGLEKASEYGLMTVYQTAKVLLWEPNHVKVGFPMGGLTSEIALDKEKRARMNEFLSKHLSSKNPNAGELEFEVVLLTVEEESQALSIHEDAKQRAEDEEKLRYQEAQEHPKTKLVLKTFGAAIKEIKVENV